LAINELRKFKNLGGMAILECTSSEMGRDAESLREISKATGLHIIVGTGFQGGNQMIGLRTKEFPFKTDTEFTEHIVKELNIGLPETKNTARAGFIGPIAISEKFTGEDKIILKGAVEAQKRTGAALMIEPYAWGRYIPKILDLIKEWGGDLSRTIISHITAVSDDELYLKTLLDRGVFLSFDMISMDFLLPTETRQVHTLLSDHFTAQVVAKVIKSGYSKQVLLSQNVSFSQMLKAYGGFGYGYILKHYVPLLIENNVSSEQINTILVDNLATLMTWWEEPEPFKIAKKYWKCDYCDKVTEDTMKPFLKNDYKYCSMKCLTAHQKELRDKEQKKKGREGDGFGGRGGSGIMTGNAWGFVVGSKD